MFLLTFASPARAHSFAKGGPHPAPASRRLDFSRERRLKDHLGPYQTESSPPPAPSNGSGPLFRPVLVIEASGSV